MADVMLRRPKTLPSSASVADVRAALANASVQIVLLADERRFNGAIAELPADADDDERALAYADGDPETLRPTDSADAACEATARHPNRRVVVLGEDDELLGLVCLNEARTQFCGRSAR